MRTRRRPCPQPQSINRIAGNNDQVQVVEADGIELTNGVRTENLPSAEAGALGLAEELVYRH